jgi:hypothetical protein
LIDGLGEWTLAHQLNLNGTSVVNDFSGILLG